MPVSSLTRDQPERAAHRARSPRTRTTRPGIPSPGRANRASRPGNRPGPSPSQQGRFGRRVASRPLFLNFKFKFTLNASEKRQPLAIGYTALQFGLNRMPKAIKPGKTSQASATTSRAMRAKTDKKPGKAGRAESKETVVNFKKTASTDYPYQKWDSEGRTKLGILEKMHQHKSTKLSEYHLFLMQKWLPEQRKRFEKEQRLAEKERVAADRARAAAAKRKERRAEERQKLGMAPAMASDEVYERRGATVRVIYM